MESKEFVSNLEKARPSLMKYAMKLCNNSSDAEDLMQETAYRAFKYRNLFKSDTNLRAWVTTIMRNIFINDFRRKKRNPTLSDWTSTNYLLNSGKHTIQNDGEGRMTIEEIEKIIAGLGDNFSVPFKMHSVGYRYQEIADELALPLGTVKSRIFSARKKIQHKLGYVA